MQKKIIAAAVAGLLAVPAFAQSNVTISGLVKAGWEQYKLSGATGGGWDYSNENRISDQSARVIIETFGEIPKWVNRLDDPSESIVFIVSSTAHRIRCSS